MCFSVRARLPAGASSRWAKLGAEVGAGTDRRGAPPILLLDVVAAHLDPARRAALFARLEGRGQVWMTATEPALFDGIGSDRATRLHVGDGRISAACTQRSSSRCQTPSE